MDNVIDEKSLHWLQNEAENFARSCLRPQALIADRTGEIPAAVLDHPWADILCSAYVPSEYGGGIQVPGRAEKLECRSQLSIVLTEILSRGDPGLTCALPGPSLAFPVLLAYGSAQQKQKYLGRFCCKKNVWGAFAITESHAGTDATALRTKATPCDGGYLLNGVKCFVTNGARADFVIVFATLNSNRGPFGLRAFIVDSKTNGFSIGAVEKTMGLRPSGICEIVLKDCFIPEENLLKDENGSAYVAGFRGAAVAWNFFRTEVSAISVGIASAIFEELKNVYKIDLPELERDIKSGRRLCQSAAWLHDNHRPMAYEVALAKAYTAQLAMDACVKGIELAGSEALQEGHLFERLFRAAKVFDILEGTGEIQREHIANTMP